MTTDNKTLADVQPGGRVRLGDGLPPLPRTHYNPCGDGSEPLYTPEQMRDYARAALSAQPSPGGQRDDSPMAKMAAALRGKAEAERAAFDQRVQSGEWGPMPDNPDVLELPPLPEEVDSVRCMIRGEKGFAEPCDYYFTSKQMRDYARTALAARQPVGRSFQAGVAEWMGQCFLPSLYSNMTERGDRLLEEVLELLQAHGYDKARVTTLVDYVFGRPVGEPAQEVGGVMVTLAGYCWVAGLDMQAAGDAELARISQPEVMAKIRAKQEAKNALHFDTPLPGSADAHLPAQAVDLVPVRELLQRRMAQWRSHLPADPSAPGTREIETKGEHDYNNDVRIYREGIAVMDEVLALIESSPAQAVDLGQFRACVLVGIRTTPEGSAERAECDRLLALIDGKAVGK